MRGAHREGQGRRHLPAPRLHPDQGSAARRRGGRDGAVRGIDRRPRDLRGDRPRRCPRLPRGHRREEVQGTRRSRQGARHHDRHRRGRLEADRAVRVGEDRYVGDGCRPRDRLVQPDASRPRDRRPHPHERAGTRARRDPRSGHRPRRRCHRRRVRERLALVRRRGHDRRGARPSRARRGPALSARRSSAPSASAASRSRSACASPRRPRPTMPSP